MTPTTPTIFVLAHGDPEATAKAVQPPAPCYIVLVNPANREHNAMLLVAYRHDTDAHERLKDLLDTALTPQELAATLQRAANIASGSARTDMWLTVAERRKIVELIDTHNAGYDEDDPEYLFPSSDEENLRSRLIMLTAGSEELFLGTSDNDEYSYHGRACQYHAKPTTHNVGSDA